MSITVYHLNNSRSQRILWLLEELGADYEIAHFQRDSETNLAPASLREIHPLGKSPMIKDGDRLIIETGAIVEHLCANHGGENLVPKAGTDDHIRHLELVHFAEGSAMTPILLNLYVSRLGEAGAPLMPRVMEQLGSNFAFLNNEVGDNGYFIGDSLSAADIMMSFPAEVAVSQAPKGTFAKLEKFVSQLQARPAYQRGLEKGGEYFLAPSPSAA